MHTAKKIRIAALAIITPVIGFGIAAAVAAPADAASSRGTMTYTESQKLVKEMKNQKCLTKTEARKIVRGKGRTVSYRYTDLVWNGSKNDMHTEGRVTFIHGCAKIVALDYDGTVEEWTKVSGKKRVKHSVSW